MNYIFTTVLNVECASWQYYIKYILQFRIAVVVDNDLSKNKSKRASIFEGHIIFTIVKKTSKQKLPLTAIVFLTLSYLLVQFDLLKNNFQPIPVTQRRQRQRNIKVLRINFFKTFFMSNK